MYCVSGLCVMLLWKHPSIQYAVAIISIRLLVPSQPSLLSAQLYWADWSFSIRPEYAINVKTIDPFIARSLTLCDLDRTRGAHIDLKTFVLNIFTDLWVLNGQTKDGEGK